jgi:hypothetical protein
VKTTVTRVKCLGTRTCDAFDEPGGTGPPGHPSGRDIAGWTPLRVGASTRVAGRAALLGAATTTAIAHLEEDASRYARALQ